MCEVILCQLRQPDRHWQTDLQTSFDLRPTFVSNIRFTLRFAGQAHKFTRTWLIDASC